MSGHLSTDLLLLGDFAWPERTAPRLTGLPREGLQVCLNLEGPILGEGRFRLAHSKWCGVYSHGEAANWLSGIGVTAVTLGNNHISDFGDQGVHSTLAALGRRNIASFGLGHSTAEALAPARIRTTGREYLIITGVDWVAGGKEPRRKAFGIARPGAAFLSAVEAARAGNPAAILIAMPHWGYELTSWPSPEQRWLARQLVDRGADLVIGHHPHVVQGWEESGGAKVVYSVGNFIFGGVAYCGIGGRTETEFVQGWGVALEGKNVTVVPVERVDRCSVDLRWDESRPLAETDPGTWPRDVSDAEYARLFRQHALRRQRYPVVEPGDGPARRRLKELQMCLLRWAGLVRHYPRRVARGASVVGS